MRLIDVYPYRSKAGRNEFLILKRSGNKRYAGQWRMIGGKIEDGERAWEAGLRELHEEISAFPNLYWTLPSINHFYNHRNDKIELIPAFAAELPYDERIILNEEHTEYKWIESKEVASFIAWPEQRRLIHTANSILTDQKILKDWKISI